MQNMKKPRLLICHFIYFLHTVGPNLVQILPLCAQQGKGTFFGQKKNIMQIRKRLIAHPEQMLFLLNKKSLKAYDLLLLFLQYFFVFAFCVAHTDPFFLRKLGRKIAIFRGFTKFCLGATGLQLKLLILIESSN